MNQISKNESEKWDELVRSGVSHYNVSEPLAAYVTIMGNHIATIYKKVVKEKIFRLEPNASLNGR